ncbi:hypothetical protein EDC04DRAFT_475595 [Pisolithus marmoratus]|nr:hypothetical protein EDC04DRAFT_1366336 [Pisolithus marmoratus]KAI6017905.1 hypothetical protein EDC04DRAFT_475595 [Pisolithus marmoratus]
MKANGMRYIVSMIYRSSGLNMWLEHGYGDETWNADRYELSRHASLLAWTHLILPSMAVSARDHPAATISIGSVAIPLKNPTITRCVISLFRNGLHALRSNFHGASLATIRRIRFTAHSIGQRRCISRTPPPSPFVPNTTRLCLVIWCVRSIRS